MDKNNRYHNQIKTLENVFAAVHEKFQNSQPVDKALSAFFRRNKQFGSNDRRFVSNTVFGYYRWYGWLNRFSSSKTSLALLLGYLLDGNKVDDRVRYWANNLDLSQEWLDQNDWQYIDSLEKKVRAVSAVIGPIQISDLNPGFVQEWSTELLTAFQSRPSIWVRIEKSDPQSFLAFLDSKHIAYRFHSANAKTLEILSTLNLNESIDFRKGRVEIQDISSQAVGLICRPKSKDVWWDACAGSGGKSLHLSALMGTNGLVYASEVNANMIRELNRRIGKNRRWSNILPLQWDGLKRPVFNRKIDGVLIDAPCSCSGTWRRNPELRWRIIKKQVDDYARVQLKLLQLCSDSVREGGALVYATCSLFPEENEAVIDKFLASEKSFHLETIVNPFSQESSEKGLTVAPPQTDGNSMYVARLRKDC